LSNEDAIYGTQVNVNCCLNLTLDIFPMKEIYYTYILKCKDGTKYYGHTADLTKRLKEHREGKVRSTRNKSPELVYYEEFDSCSDAFRREIQFKNGRTRKETIEKLIGSFSLEKCQGFNSHSDLCSLSFHKSRAH